MPAGFADAYAQLREAQSKCGQAEQQADVAACDAYLKSAYQTMYTAARTAHMLFEASYEGALGGDEIGFGAQGGRFSWAKDRLDGFSRILLRQYCLQGDFPSGDTETCNRWIADVKAYVDDLMADAGISRGVQAANDRWAAGSAREMGQAIEGTGGRVMYDPRDFV